MNGEGEKLQEKVVKQGGWLKRWDEWRRGRGTPKDMNSM
jgi:hypothetical protein